MRLLLVEDDPDMAGAIGSVLAKRGFACDHAGSVADALLMTEVASYAAVLLDRGLPDGDGMEVVRRLRHRPDPIPIIMLTARDAVASRVEGLDAGADDYLLKPFDIEELLARLRAVLRRPVAMQAQEVVVGNVGFRPEGRLCTVDGVRLTLSTRETELADLLLRRAGHVLPKRLVEDQLFGLDGGLGSNAVEVYLHRLRRKLEAAGADVVIETIRGVGYVLQKRRS